jgi:hypothetical protein
MAGLLTPVYAAVAISKTSIAAFFVAMAFYLFKDKALTRAARIKIAIAGTVILGSLSGLLIAYFNNYAESTNPETLTGRTIIWATAGELAIEKPILGHGFYSFHFAVLSSATSKQLTPTTNFSSSSSPSESWASSSSSASTGSSSGRFAALQSPPSRPSPQALARLRPRSRPHRHRAQRHLLPSLAHGHVLHLLAAKSPPPEVST